MASGNGERGVLMLVVERMPIYVRIGEATSDAKPFAFKCSDRHVKRDRVCPYFERWARICR